MLLKDFIVILLQLWWPTEVANQTKSKKGLLLVVMVLPVAVVEMVQLLLTRIIQQLGLWMKEWILLPRSLDLILRSNNRRRDNL